MKNKVNQGRFLWNEAKKIIPGGNGLLSKRPDRYAKDIQSVLENTKVVIIPTPKETPAFNIASLNE